MIEVLNKYYEGFPLCFHSYENTNNKITLNFINCNNTNIEEIIIEYNNKEYNFKLNSNEYNINCSIDEFDSNLVSIPYLVSVKADEKIYKIDDYKTCCSIIKPKSVNFLGKEKFLYKDEFSTKTKYPKDKIKYLPFKNKNYWHCVCGNINFGNINKCTECGIEKEKVFSVTTSYEEQAYETNEYIKLNSSCIIWYILLYVIYILHQAFTGDFAFHNDIKNNLFGIINRFIVPLTLIVCTTVIIMCLYRYFNKYKKIFTFIRLGTILYMNIIAAVFTIHTAYNSIFLWGVDALVVVYFIYVNLKIKKSNIFRISYFAFTIILLLVSIIKLSIYSKYDLIIDNNGLIFTVHTKDETYKLPNTLDNIPVSTVRFNRNEDYNLKKIFFNANMQNIEIHSSSVLPKLEEVNLDKNNKNFIVQDKILYTKEGSIIIIPITVKTVTIRSEVVEKNSMHYVLGLEKIIISNNVKKIEGYAFYHCPNLKSIEFEDNSKLEYIGDYAFGDCSSLLELKIPDSVLGYGAGILSGCTSLKKFVTPFIGIERETEVDDVFATDIFCKMFGTGDYLRYELIPASLEYVEITDVDLIHNVTFYGAEYIKKIVMPDNMINIGIKSFYRCSRLEEFKIPNGITIIKESCFEKCVGLKKIIIPASVIKIDKDAFLYCNGLKEVIYEGNINDLVIEDGNDIIKFKLNID